MVSNMATTSPAATAALPNALSLIARTPQVTYCFLLRVPGPKVRQAPEQVTHSLQRRRDRRASRPSSGDDVPTPRRATR